MFKYITLMQNENISMFKNIALFCDKSSNYETLYCNCTCLIFKNVHN